MAEKRLNARLVNKHDIESNWILATNFTPKQGEIIVYDIDENYSYERFKIGDGVQNVNALPFADDALKTALEAEIGAVSALVGDTSVSEQIDTAIEESKADWNQNDENAIDYIKNRTHYEEVVNQPYILVKDLEAGKTPDGMFFLSDGLERGFLPGDVLEITLRDAILQHDDLIYIGTVEDDGSDIYAGDIINFLWPAELDNTYPYYLEPLLCSIDDNGKFRVQLNCSNFRKLTIRLLNVTQEETVVHHLDPKYIKDMYYEAEPIEVTLVDNLTSDTEEDWPACTFVVGDRYKVIWNGTEYDCTCFFDGEWRILGTTDNYPFYIDDDGGDSLYIEGDEPWTVSIIHVKQEIHHIHPKYIKDMYYDNRSYYTTEEKTVDGTIITWSMMKVADAIDFDINKVTSVSLRTSAGVEITDAPVLVSLDTYGTLLGTNTAEYGEYWPFAYFATQEEADNYWDNDNEDNPFGVGLYANVYDFENGMELEDGENVEIKYNFTVEAGEVHQIDNKYIKDMYYDNGIIETFVPETTIEFDLDVSDFIEGAIDINLVIGDTYFVNWNGVEYECVCYYSGGDLAIGNDACFGGNGGNGEPFVISNYSGITVINVYESGSYTISIVGQHRDLKQIDTKYLSILEKASVVVAEGTLTNNNELSNPAYKKLVGKGRVTFDGFSEIVEFIDYGSYSYAISSGDLGPVARIETWDGGIWFDIDLDGGQSHSVKIEILKDIIKKEYMPNLTSDWNQNDPDGAGYIANRTHWMEEVPVNLIDNQDIEVFHETSGFSSNYVNIPIDRRPQYGEKYIVVWDGVEYILNAEEDDGYTYLGIDYYYNTNPDDEIYPFGLCFNASEGQTLSAVITTSSESWHTLSLTRLDPVFHKIDANYLPDDIATVNDVHSVANEKLTLKNIATSMPSNQYWNEVCYGDGKFVAISGVHLADAAAPSVLQSRSKEAAYSIDGTTWTTTSMPSSQYWSAVCYGGGKFVAIASTTNIAAYSADGVTWTETTLPSQATWNCVCYGNGKFIATCGNGMAYSADGINWTKINCPINAISAICYGNGKFVVMSPFDGAYSVDGITWHTITNPISHLVNSTQPTLYYGNGKFILLTAYYINYSTDSINWSEPIKISNRNYWNAICYINGKFVALNGVYNSFAYSTDGVNWTEMYDDKGIVAFPSGSSVYHKEFKTACSNTLCIAIATGVSSDKLIITTDGINWRNSCDTIMQNNEVVTNQVKDLILSDMSTVEIDATLSIEGQAADAKAVGEAIDGLNALVGDTSVAEQINNAIVIATDDEILELLAQEDMLPVVKDSDGSLLADENENILLW